MDDFEGTMACVVTGDVFSTIDGYVDIFHEFVHCYQFEQCENDLKRSLGVAVKAKAANDYMWEISCPFQYQDPRVCHEYSSLLESLRNSDYEAVFRYRKALRKTLNDYAFECMVWQEWKEGFARHIENRIRCCLELPLNLGGDLGGGASPFTRVSFYAGVAALIGFLESWQPRVVRDLRLLFAELMAIGLDS